MQTAVGTQLQAVLENRDRDLICVIELYAHDYDPSASGFDPRDALQTFAGVKFTLPFGPTVYRREVLQGPSIQKHKGKEFNSVSIRFSNVSRYMANFVLTNQVEQMRLVVRVISRSVATAIGNSASILLNSAILFVGRCKKPDGFNRSTGTISATPDMGTILAQIPPRLFQASCPLPFKGLECLGSEELGEKSAAYQTAVICNKLPGGDCTVYENTEFTQGVTLIQISSSFVHKANESFFKKVLNVLPGISRKKVTVNNSLHDGTPYGSPIPLIFGRWYKLLLPLQYQDIGTSINCLLAACRGKISDFINLRTQTLGFTAPIGVTKHLGEYGGVGTQTEDTVFPQGGFYSRLAYVTLYVNGTDIEIEDAAPEIAAVIAGIVPDQIYFDVDHDGTGKLSIGSGGVTAPGASFTTPASPAASFDAALFEIGTPEYYFKQEETELGSVFPTPTGGMTDSGGKGNHGWHIDAVSGSGSFTILDISTPELPVETDSASRFAAGPIGFLPAPSGSDLDPRGTQTWIAIARMTSHVAQSYILNRGTDTVGGVPFGMSFGLGAGSNTLFIAFGNGSVGGGGTLSYGPIVEDGRPYLIVFTREESALRLYVNGCLVDSLDSFPTGDIIHADFNNTAWRFGYTPNFAFGPVHQSQGASRIIMFKGIAATFEQQSRLWASMRNTPTGCPGEDWTDNPVDHARFILTEPSLMNNSDESIDDFLSAYAAAYNCGAIKDDSNAERCLLPNTETAKAGVDYKRYYSTGLLGPASFESTRTQIPAGVPARECEYEFFDPATPPTSLDVEVVYRKRYTHNVEVNDSRKAVDFLYDTVFPTFRGFLRWNIKGQTIIDSERPADWTSLHLESEADAESITVKDVLPWKTILGSPYLLHGKVHLDRQIAFVYDNAAIRENDPDLEAEDVGRFALQRDNNTIWRLTADTPTWEQETEEISEVRAVTEAVYSDLGDEITLASSASGGPTATASGANLTGGSDTVQSSGTVTITGSLAEDATITVEIDGIECVLDLVENENSATIGHRMAAVINATPEVNGYVEAHGEDNVVTIYSKLGVLTLSSALEEAHTVNTEITRVLFSMADKARTYADTDRANILDGSFNWPHAGRQSPTNQIKADYRESVRDFGKQPLIINDYDHQEKTNKTETFEVDYQAVDNYNTAARLGNGLLNTLRDGDKFFEWGSTGIALLLDEGDVGCVSHPSGPFRNQLVRLEDIEISNDLEVNFVARKYSRLQLSDLVAQPAGLQIPSALTNFQEPPPNIAFNEIDFPPDGLTQTTDGTLGITTIYGGVIFGETIYKAGMYAKIRLIKRGGVDVDISINGRLLPNSENEAEFEFVASVDGLYVVEAVACNQWGCSSAVTAIIVVGLGAVQGLWITPMVEFSGVGSVEWVGSGTYTIPMITESSTGDPEPAGGGNYNIP